MQVSIESTGDLGRRVVFRVPSADLEGRVGSRLREIARDARIKGFRPGKVPTSVIEKRFGPQVRAEILDNLLREGFGDALREETFQIAGSPRIEPSDEAAGEGELLHIEPVAALLLLRAMALEAARHEDGANLGLEIDLLRGRRRKVVRGRLGHQHGGPAADQQGR